MMTITFFGKNLLLEVVAREMIFALITKFLTITFILFVQKISDIITTTTATIATSVAAITTIATSETIITPIATLETTTPTITMTMPETTTTLHG